MDNRDIHKDNNNSINKHEPYVTPSIVPNCCQNCSNFKKNNFCSCALPSIESGFTC